MERRNEFQTRSGFTSISVIRVSHITVVDLQNMVDFPVHATCPVRSAGNFKVIAHCTVLMNRQSSLSSQTWNIRKTAVDVHILRAILIVQRTVIS